MNRHSDQDMCELYNVGSDQENLQVLIETGNVPLNSVVQPTK